MQDVTRTCWAWREGRVVDYPVTDGDGRGRVRDADRRGKTMSDRATPDGAAGRRMMPEGLTALMTALSEYPSSC